MLDVDDSTDVAHRDLAEKVMEYEARALEYEDEINELRDSLDEMVRKHEDQETQIQSLREKNRKWKRKQFDWTTKEKEYKSLLRQYSEIRESNAKLTLTYWTLQCQYDKLVMDRICGFVGFVGFTDLHSISRSKGRRLCGQTLHSMQLK